MELIDNGFKGNKADFEAQLQRDGGRVLKQAPDGPILPCFKALDLAQAIEAEIERGSGRGQTKIQLNMNFKDASEMAQYLRRAALRGV